MAPRDRGRLSGVEVVVVDEHERPLVLADATDESYAADGARELFNARRQTVGDGVPYGLLVSPACIRVFNGAGSEPVARLDTAEVLRAYDPELQPGHVAPRYLVCLVEAWLSDLAYRWRGEPVPGEQTLTALGLTEKLRAGAAHVVPDERGGLRP